MVLPLSRTGKRNQGGYAKFSCFGEPLDFELAAPFTRTVSFAPLRRKVCWGKGLSSARIGRTYEEQNHIRQSEAGGRRQRGRDRDADRRLQAADLGGLACARSPPAGGTRTRRNVRRRPVVAAAGAEGVGDYGRDLAARGRRHVFEHGGARDSGRADGVFDPARRYLLSRVDGGAADRRTRTGRP